MQENVVHRLINRKLSPILRTKVYPIIRSGNAQEVIDTAKAMVEGGVEAIEINLVNESIYDAINEVSKFALVSAGGVITRQQASKAMEAGAKVLSSPVYQMSMVKISKGKGIPLIACVTTPNEAYEAWKTRVRLLKVYPTAALGGRLYIEDLLRLMPFLNILASGNIKIDEVAGYLKTGATAVGIGRALYENSTFKEITEKSKKVIEIAKGI